MKENKIAIICACIIVIVSFLVSLLFYNKGIDYYSNLFSGIFASGILTLAIAVINYCVYKRKTLESFYSYAMKAVANFNLFENGGSIEKSIDSVLLIAQFDYSELNTAYGDICFLFNDKDNRRYIYDKIYCPIMNLAKIIDEKSYHFKEFKKAEHGNETAMKEFIKELDDLIMEQQNCIRDKDNSQIRMTFRRNKMTKLLIPELNGRYYELMYGRHTLMQGNHPECI